MTKIWKQTFLKIDLFWRKKSNLIFSSILFALFIILDSVALYLIKDASSPSLMLINLFVILQSLLLAIFVIFLTIKVFRGEINDSVHKTELRFGMKRSELFVSRLFMAFIIIALVFLVMLIVNFIFVFASSEFQSVLGYRIYISSLAWYAIASFITFTITLLLSVFFSEIIAGIFSVIVFAGLVVSSFAAPAVFKNKGLSQEIQDVMWHGTERRNYEEYREMKIFESLKKINKNEFNPEKMHEFIQNIQIVPDLEKDSSWYNQTNIRYLGLEYWQNQEELAEKNSSIFAMMKYFENYFNQANHKWFTYEDINGLGRDEWLNERIEPIHELLKKMRKDIDSHYQDLINVLIKLNHDVQGLHSLESDYLWHNDGGYVEDQKGQLTKFVTEEEINPSKILFFKAFLQLLEGQQVFYNYSNENSTFDDWVIIGGVYTKEMVLNQRKNVMINPLLQISAMFQSINYQDYYLDNSLASSETLFNSTTNFYVENNSVHRTLYSEGIYVAYFAFNCLLIYLAYFKFRKNTIK